MKWCVVRCVHEASRSASKCLWWRELGRVWDGLWPICDKRTGTTPGCDLTRRLTKNSLFVWTETWRVGIASFQSRVQADSAGNSAPPRCNNTSCHSQHALHSHPRRSFRCVCTATQPCLACASAPRDSKRQNNAQCVPPGTRAKRRKELSP